MNTMKILLFMRLSCAYHCAITALLPIFQHVTIALSAPYHRSHYRRSIHKVLSKNSESMFLCKSSVNVLRILRILSTEFTDEA